MNATAVSIAEESIQLLPAWLQDCLRGGTEAGSDKDRDLICRAFEFAYALHEGQTRKSGEPYIAHPIAVASLLRDLGGDSATIAAGFLHDVVEDTDVSPEEIEARFGEDVRHLVEAVTKLSKFNFSSKTERQAENFRRMFVAMAQDIRVIVVKLADRLHNMRTLQYLKPEKQQQIALETREIFAPLANRLGIGRFKWELEDLSFKYLEAEAYRQIQTLVAERRAAREQRLEEAVALLRERLEKTGIAIRELTGRPKHLYGIYRKMQQQQKAFEKIYDLAGIRIIVETKEECYRALAIVHDAFKPIPGRFKDYIGLPKPNRYQSLHTTVIGSTGRPLEVQIRTLEMHYIAENGIAAHWMYKESGGSNFQPSTEDEKFTWLRQLLEWQNDLRDAREYVENLKNNLFEDDVYVFTPKGDVIALTRNSTPVDFAYRIHTEVGNHMKGARVNDRWTTLDRPLENGDIVEIVTSKNSHPSLDWLNCAATPSARNRIRQWFKRSHREENITRGRSLLEKEMGKNGFEALLKSDKMQAVAERCNYSNPDDLLAALGYGEITTGAIANKLRESSLAVVEETDASTLEAEAQSLQKLLAAPSDPKKGKSPIVGVEGLMYHLAGCCCPLPGDPIVGSVTRLRGVSIHQQVCPNVARLPGERLLPVSWNRIDERGRVPTYPVALVIDTIDRVGIFRDILAHFSDRNINVLDAGVKTSPDKTARISVSIEIRDTKELAQIFAGIRKMSDILSLRRVSEAA